MADKSVAVRAVSATLMSVAIVTVALRCYVRVRLIKSFGADDWTMLGALACYIFLAACMIGGSLHGMGKHVIDLAPAEQVVARKYFWFCEFSYCFATVGCKVSVSLFLMRVTIRRLHRWILISVIFLTAATGLVLFFVLVLQCSPLNAAWNNPTSPTCIDPNIIIEVLYVYSALVALCDFTVGILPAFLVYNLNMTWKNKAAVTGILSMGCVASVAILVRFPYVKTLREPDFLYSIADLSIWSSIEAGLGIAAGSLATLRPLFRCMRESIVDKNSQGQQWPSDAPSGNPQDTRNRHRFAIPKRSSPKSTDYDPEATLAASDNWSGKCILTESNTPSEHDFKVGQESVIELSRKD